MGKNSNIEKPKDVIPGGLASGKKPDDFDQEQLNVGTKVEMEHTSSKDVAKEIAMDHLTEDPDYYKKLKTIEKASLLTRMQKAYIDPHSPSTEDLQKKQGVPKGVDPAKHERCVKEVKAKGHDKSSAYAICNASVKKSFSERLLKASGEGSRGGKIVGHTKSGKPIYSGSKEAENPVKQEPEVTKIPGVGVGINAEAMQQKLKADRDKPRTLSLAEIGPYHYSEAPNLTKYRKILKLSGERLNGHITYDAKTDSIKTISAEAPKLLESIINRNGQKTQS